MRKVLGIIAIALAWSLLAGAVSASAYDCSVDCSSPPFITSGVKPNVLVIMDNSNSMDEDFYGNAAGSFSSVSKAYVARQAMIQLIALLKDKMRVGLMTYELPSSGIVSNYLHNSPYFVSYEPKSYCPEPPEACQQYCKDDTNTTARDECQTECRAQTGAGSFDATYRDEIITNYAVGSEQRNRYCDLVYPKTQRMVNPSDTSNYMYYKHALPFYSGSGEGTDYCYSTGYNASEGATYDTYRIYPQKTGTADDLTGYGGSYSSSQLSPTDSDFALGFYDFGRRLMWYQVGKTWFNNSSPGGGFLDDSPDVRINDLVNTSGVTTSTYTNLMTKLALKTETEYMSCTSSNKNTGCDYVVNAGLTPTAGTLQDALDYFTGTSSPITLRCQKNFIVYVTDGLPSVDESGVAKTATELMPTVKTKLQALRSITKSVSGKNYTFDVKTYVLGLGLTDQAKLKLDEMAVAGGTDVDGHAYYVDDATDMVNQLGAVLGDILKRVASGTSISILSEKAQKGANIMQAVFYPSKLFGLENILWTGFLYDYWFYVSKTKSNIREDTDENLILDLQQDRAMEFNFSEDEGLQIALRNDVNGDGDLENDGDNVSATVTLDGVTPIWEAGYQLFLKAPNTRRIYTVGSSNTLVPLSSTSDYSVSSFGSTFNACLTGADLAASRNNIISYVYGNDISGCRDRTVSIDGNTQTWKLGDIIYSTPRVVSDFHFCKDSVGAFTSQHCASSADCSAIGGTCVKKESAVFVGANDGMLHAFKTGILSSLSGSTQVARLDNYGAEDLGEELWAFIPKNALPYLRCLAASDYCHQYTVDLSPYIVDMGTKKVLIGGMRLGGAACSQSANKYCFDTATKTFESPLKSCSGDNQCKTSPYTQCIAEYTCNAPDDTCPARAAACDPESPYTCYSDNCVGLSSYFALDITNPEAPALLWEFSHPRLGYSYSGPAVIKRGGSYYVLFASGPTARNGDCTQNLRTFALSLKADLTIDSVYEHDFGSSLTKSFGGRLYTTGLDMNNDGNTDFVFLGVTQLSPSLGNYSGNIIKLWTGSTNPALWEYNTNYFEAAQQPISAKVEFASCFNRWYVYATSGRYFYSGETYEPQNDFIMGAPILCNEDNECDQPNINFGHGNDTNFCEDLSSDGTADAWYWELNDDEGIYLKERGITDPTVTTYNAVYFTTSEPTADLCGYGGRTRVWGLNCATGLAISDTSCEGHTVTQNIGSLYLQTSTGEITALSSAESFTLNDNKCSGWIEGVPPENSPPFVPPYEALQGKILHWIER